MVRTLEGCASTTAIMTHASTVAQFVGGRRDERTDTGVDEQLIASPCCAHGKQLA